VPRREWRQHVRLLPRRFRRAEQAAQPALDQSGHRRPSPRRLLLQPLHDGVVDVERHLHMANHTTSRTKAAPAAFEAVAEEVFRRYGSTWKQRTGKVNRAYLRNQILPWFRRRPIGDITHSEVQRWFAALHATLAAANRSLPILSVTLRQAEIYGHRPDGSNPCTGLRRYRERGRDRFLTGDEFRRLGAALAAHEVVTPLAVSVVRLLALPVMRSRRPSTAGGERSTRGSSCSDRPLFSSRASRRAPSREVSATAICQRRICLSPPTRLADRCARNCATRSLPCLQALPGSGSRVLLLRSALRAFPAPTAWRVR